MKGVITVLVVLAMVQLMIKPIEAFTCGELAKKVMPCAPYVTGSASQPSPQCCIGVKQLKTMMVIKDDAHEMCKCLKAAASAYPNIKDAALSALPDKCGAPLPFTVSKNMDCNQFNP